MRRDCWRAHDGIISTPSAYLRDPGHVAGRLRTALGQSAPSGSPSFQERIREVARALQNQPSLKDLSEQQRIDRVEFVVGNTLFILLHELGHVHFSEMHLP